MEIRVRFAPSNTGVLHIGGARTAIYNYLFARQKEGKFLIRIEDTDLKRSSEEYTEQILDSLRWLGLNWDETVYRQSKNLNKHRSAVEKMLQSGMAYRCFCPPEEYEKRRMEQEKQGKQYFYDRKCRYLSQEEIDRNLQEGKPFAVRIAVPDEGRVQFNDLVYGRITTEYKEIDDFIIMRSNGIPVYHLAVVVDDIEMGITHVIRGEDHLSNTPKQILIYRALEARIPEFAHLPMILGADGKRLSKRHGATGVDEYREMGYLPQAIINYIALLGWNPGDEEEYMSLPRLIERFSLERVSRKSAIFDPRKLEWISNQHFSHLEATALYPLVLERLRNEGLVDRLTSEDENYIKAMIELLKSRARTLNNFVEWGYYFFRDPEEYDQAALKKRWKQDSAQHLQSYLDCSSAIKDYVAPEIEANLRECAEKLGISAGKLIHPIRIAITGYGVGPGLFQLMEVLGRERVTRRIKKAIERLK